MLILACKIGALGSREHRLAALCRKQAHPLALSRAPYALTWSQAFRVLLRRQWKLTVRDSALVRGRIIQVQN